MSGKTRRKLFVVRGLFTLLILSALLLTACSTDGEGGVLLEPPEPTETPPPTDIPPLEDDIWQLEVLSIDQEITSLRDMQGNSVYPNTGSHFVVVRTRLANISGEEQTMNIGMGIAPATFIASGGEGYGLAGILRNGSATLNSFQTISFMYFYPDTEGESVDFYFAVPVEVDSGEFSFADLTSIELTGLQGAPPEVAEEPAEEDAEEAEEADDPAESSPTPIPTATPEPIPTADPDATSPRIGTPGETRRAYDAETPFLGHIAGEYEEDVVSDSETWYIFELTITLDQDTLAGGGWCAVNLETLEENMQHMDYFFVVNGEDISPDSVIVTDYEYDDGVACRDHTILLTDWPVGDHNITVLNFRNGEIFDGWDTFGPGLLGSEYYVTVEE